MITLFITFLLLFHSSFTYNCSEESHDKYVEIQCPSSQQIDFTIQIYQNESTIQCVENLETLPWRNFPKMTTNMSNGSFEMKYCPWMSEPLSTLFNGLSLHQVNSLKVSATSDNKDISLTSEFLVGLSTLQTLRLNKNKIRNLDSGVFELVPQLKFLDLSENNLENLPLDVFKPLKQLQHLHLWANKLTKIDGRTFQGLHQLQSLELSSNRIEKITVDVFKDLHSLANINLGANRGLSLEDELFVNTSVDEVRIAKCNLLRLPGKLFHHAERLRIVNLQDNKLTEIPKDLFQGLTNLEQVWLDNNRIKNLDGIFSGLKNLKTLSLQNNLIEELSAEVLIDLGNLERLVLKRNKIKHVSSAVFQRKRLKTVDLSFNSIVTPLGELIDLNDTPSLVELNLKHNLIPTVRLDRLSSKRDISIKLDSNNITTIDFTNVTSSSSSIKISLRKNSIDCCQNYDLLEHFIEPRVPNLMIYPKKICNTNRNRTKTVLKCPLENMSKKYTSCSDCCNCSWIPAAKSILIDCSYRNLTEFPTIDLSRVDFVVFNQSEGRFEGNRLKVGPNKSDVFENMTRLFLSYNEIREIDWLPPRLEVLGLDHNRITTLKHEVVQALNNSQLAELSLSTNSWVCDCKSASLADFLRERASLVQNLVHVTCTNREGTLLSVNKSELCILVDKNYIVLPILVFLLLIATLIALSFRYKQSLKIWLFSKHLCRFWLTEEEMDKDKTFDAFISYSHKDERLVTELANRLESQGYKLCLHYRDWIPGELISEQIAFSIAKSRRTIVVLTENFLRSEWAKLEFRTAYIQAVLEERTRVIIILHDDVDVNELDKEFQAYLNTNTYIKWDTVYFWERLRYALPHNVGELNTTRMREEKKLINCGLAYERSTPPC